MYNPVISPNSGMHYPFETKLTNFVIKALEHIVDHTNQPQIIDLHFVITNKYFILPEFAIHGEIL